MSLSALKAELNEVKENPQHSQAQPKSLQISVRNARVVMGIFTADNEEERRYRSKFRQLFKLDPRVCSLAAYQRRNIDTLYNSQKIVAPTKITSSGQVVECELIYTFVAGANPHGPTELVVETLDQPFLVNRPVASQSRDFNNEDMTLLNIQ